MLIHSAVSPRDIDAGALPGLYALDDQLAAGLPADLRPGPPGGPGRPPRQP